MGLDSYFYKKKSTYEHPQATKENPFAGPHRITTVLDEVGYYRKFNALHAYIVEQFADGADLCQPIELSKDNVYTILEILTTIRDDHSQAYLMPPTGGFFFGSTDVDEWYFRAVEDAVQLFGKFLAEIDFETEGLVYQASW